MLSHKCSMCTIHPLPFVSLLPSALQFLITRATKSLGRSVPTRTVLLRITIVYVQILYLIMSAIREPDVDDQLGWYEITISLFEVSARLEGALGCLIGWDAYARTVFYMCLPLVAVFQLLIFSSAFQILLRCFNKERATEVWWVCPALR